MIHQGAIFKGDKLTANVGYNFDTGSSIPEAPKDGKLYGRKNADWEEMTNAGVPGTYTQGVDFTDFQTFLNEKINGRTFDDSLIIQLNSDVQSAYNEWLEIKNITFTGESVFNLSMNGTADIELRKPFVFSNINAAGITLSGRFTMVGSGAVYADNCSDIYAQFDVNRDYDFISNAGTLSFIGCGKVVLSSYSQHLAGEHRISVNSLVIENACTIIEGGNLIFKTMSGNGVLHINQSTVLQYSKINFNGIINDERQVEDGLSTFVRELPEMLTDAPKDSKLYGRKNAEWKEVAFPADDFVRRGVVKSYVEGADFGGTDAEVQKWIDSNINNRFFEDNAVNLLEITFNTVRTAAKFVFSNVTLRHDMTFNLKNNGQQFAKYLRMDNINAVVQFLCTGKPLGELAVNGGTGYLACNNIHRLGISGNVEWATTDGSFTNIPRLFLANANNSNIKFDVLSLSAGMDVYVYPSLTNRAVAINKLTGDTGSLTIASGANITVGTVEATAEIKDDRSGNPLDTFVRRKNLRDNPHLWPFDMVNHIELNLGEGVYGMRLDFLSNAAATDLGQTTIMSDWNPNWTIVDCGGYWVDGDPYKSKRLIGHTFISQFDPLTVMFTSCIHNSDNYLRLMTQSQYKRTAAPLSVWVKYTK